MNTLENKCINIYKNKYGNILKNYTVNMFALPYPFYVIY